MNTDKPVPTPPHAPRIDKPDDEPKESVQADIPDSATDMPGWPGNPKDDDKRASGLPQTSGQQRRAAEKRRA